MSQSLPHTPMTVIVLNFGRRYIRTLFRNGEMSWSDNRLTAHEKEEQGSLADDICTHRAHHFLSDQLTLLSSSLELETRFPSAFGLFLPNVTILGSVYRAVAWFAASTSAVSEPSCLPYPDEGPGILFVSQRRETE